MECPSSWERSYQLYRIRIRWIWVAMTVSIHCLHDGFCMLRRLGQMHLFCICHWQSLQPGCFKQSLQVSIFLTMTPWALTQMPGQNGQRREPNAVSCNRSPRLKLRTLSNIPWDYAAWFRAQAKGSVTEVCKQFLEARHLKQRLHGLFIVFEI